MNRENQEECSRSNYSRDTNVPRIQEDYITHVSEEIEGRVSKKLPQEFSKTEIRILPAFFKWEEFILSPQVWVNSGPIQ